MTPQDQFDQMGSDAQMPPDLYAERPDQVPYGRREQSAQSNQAADVQPQGLYGQRGEDVSIPPPAEQRKDDASEPSAIADARQQAGDVSERSAIPDVQPQGLYGQPREDVAVQPPSEQQAGDKSDRSAIAGARQQAGAQVDQAIDQFAARVPGGQEHAEQAKEAAGGALDKMEHEAERQTATPGGLRGMIGRLFGGDRGSTE